MSGANGKQTLISVYPLCFSWRGAARPPAIAMRHLASYYQSLQSFSLSARNFLKFFYVGPFLGNKRQAVCKTENFLIIIESFRGAWNGGAFVYTTLIIRTQDSLRTVISVGSYPARESRNLNKLAQFDWNPSMNLFLDLPLELNPHSSPL